MELATIPVHPEIVRLPRVYASGLKAVCACIANFSRKFYIASVIRPSNP